MIERMIKTENRIELPSFPVSVLRRMAEEKGMR